MSIGSRIRELRKGRNLNQAELAELMQLTSGAMSSIELGKNNPTSELIIKLSEFFEVSTDYLLKGIESERTISENEQEIIEILRKDDALTQAIKEAANLKKKAISYLVSYKQPEQNAAVG
jgi:transcriptional regulator with XRE-family HTH domain